MVKDEASKGPFPPWNGGAGHRKRTAYLLDCKAKALEKGLPFPKKPFCVVLSIAEGKHKVVDLEKIDSEEMTDEELAAIHDMIEGNRRLKAVMNHGFLQGKVEDMKMFRCMYGLRTSAGSSFYNNIFK